LSRGHPMARPCRIWCRCSILHPPRDLRSQTPMGTGLTLVARGNDAGLESPCQAPRRRNRYRALRGGDSAVTHSGYSSYCVRFVTRTGPRWEEAMMRRIAILVGTIHCSRCDSAVRNAGGTSQSSRPKRIIKAQQVPSRSVSTNVDVAPKGFGAGDYYVFHIRLTEFEGRAHRAHRRNSARSSSSSTRPRAISAS